MSLIIKFNWLIDRHLLISWKNYCDDKTLIVQLATTGGKTTFFVARTTYPSEDYYEQKVESSPGRIGVMYIVKPVTADTEGTVFCNIKGDNFTETNISIGVKPGGT